ncbi:MAG: DUF692 domain-containing protein [Burkholderiaceae bacterium]|nr:DUF692 domain-containing protein [Burkholderiaceae bacterium]
MSPASVIALPSCPPRRPPTGLPLQAGIGLRSPHHQEMLATLPPTGWLEAHSENFFGAGGDALRVLEQLRHHYPVSLHGVGMSLGSVAGPNARHLGKLQALVERVQPAAVSEHLCWSAVGPTHLNDLLPLPYTDEAMSVVCANVARVQDALDQVILVENVSSYLQFAQADYTEWDFLAEVARRTGCGILLDVNNIHVSACNHGFDAGTYLQALPRSAIGEIHLAGFETDESGGFLVDTHSRPVHAAVWALYAKALERFGPQPTLIEWDNDIPELAVLLAQAEQAEKHLQAAESRHAHA